MAYEDYPAFNNGQDADIFLKVSNGTIYKGRVWPGVTAFPDWFHENVQDYWNGEFQSFFSPETGVDIDALWIDMNEPSNFCIWPCPHPELNTESAMESFNKMHQTRALARPPRDAATIRFQKQSLRGAVPRQDSGSKRGLPGRNLTLPSCEYLLNEVHVRHGLISHLHLKTRSTTVGGRSATRPQTPI